MKGRRGRRTLLRLELLYGVLSLLLSASSGRRLWTIARIGFLEDNLVQLCFEQFQAFEGA